MKSGRDHLNDRADQGSARIHLLVARHCLKKVFIRHTYSSSVVILSMITLSIDYWPIKFLSLKHCSRLICILYHMFMVPRMANNTEEPFVQILFAWGGEGVQILL